MVSVRNPVRSEADAFHIVAGSTVVLAAAVVLGALLSPLVGVALLVGAVAGALVWEVATQDPDRRRPPGLLAGERRAFIRAGDRRRHGVA